MRDMVIVPTKSHFNPDQNGSEKLFWGEIEICKKEGVRGGLRAKVAVAAYGGDIVMSRLPSISAPG